MRQQHAVQAGAVHAAHRDALDVVGDREDRAAGPVERPTGPGGDPDLLGLDVDAQRVQRRDPVAGERDPRADLAELGGPFQHRHPPSGARQRDRRGEARDATAGDDGLHVRAHVP